MDAGQLVAAFRQRADDEAVPYLFSDERAYYFASEAEKEACVRTLLLSDETSPFLTINVTAGQAVYPLDSRVFRIEAARFIPTSGHACALELTGLDTLRNRDSALSDEGRPSTIVHHGNTIRLWPKPRIGVTGQINLSVYRLPLAAMEAETDEPEIPPEHHDPLIDWMMYLAYSTKDSDKEDPARAERAKQRFEQHFGFRPNTETQRYWRERRNLTVRYGGY